MDYATRGVGYYETQNLDGHMEIMRQTVRESLNDGELHRLAVRIVSGTYDWAEDPRTGRRVPIVEGWGKQFNAPDLDICGPKDDACELAFLWAFVVLNCRYVYDMSSADLFKTARISLVDGGGDCDDSTIVFCSLAQALGFEHTVARVISTDGEGWVHVYPIIACPKDDPKVWIPLDCTVEGVEPGWQAPFVAHRDFDMRT